MDYSRHLDLVSNLHAAFDLEQVIAHMHDLWKRFNSEEASKKK
jgi:hypothetical protein